ncbi:MAG: tetratricopeptide repeat protein [Myxococcota bacterium]
MLFWNGEGGPFGLSELAVPEPPGYSRGVREADEEIREIKKEIIESRGLAIKTSNLVSSLAADIKSIAKRQAGYERRFNWNSAVAYVLFATLSFVGLKLATDAAIREIASEKEELSDEVRELRQELDDETSRAESRNSAEVEAARYYELIRQQKRSEVVEGFERIRQLELSRAESAFFRDTVDQFRLDLSVVAYQGGLDRIRTGRYAEAAEKFQEAIELADTGAHIPSVKYQLARAYRRLNRQGEAKILAQEVVDQDIDRELQDDAVWLVSQCAEELGELDEARNALRTLIRRWPRSSLSTDARRHLGELNLRAMRGGVAPR